MKRRIGRLWADLHASLWLKPALAMIVALALGTVLSRISVPGDSLLGGIVFRGSGGDARELLSTVTGTMITVTSLVFALTVVALQIASTQFSPRLLRHFLRDNGTQLVMSVFVGTVAYSLAGLHTVGVVNEAGEAFVPNLAVSGALALALLSVGMLVYYIHHITDSIRIDTVMRNVERATLQVVRRLPPDDGRPAAAPLPTTRAEAIPLPAAASGYVQGLSLDELAAMAAHDDAYVRFVAEIGQHVTEGLTLAWVWGQHVDRDRYRAATQSAVYIDKERKIELDVGFGMRQLVDIATRALSPSINDPYTAVQAIDHLTVVLSEVARRRTDPELRRDADGVVRVAATTPDFAHLVRTACQQLRPFAVDHPRVVLALMHMLGTIGVATSDVDRRKLVCDQIELVLDDAERVIPQPADLAVVRATGASALEDLTSPQMSFRRGP